MVQKEYSDGADASAGQANMYMGTWPETHLIH